MYPCPYSCGVDAEPLYRYQADGFHPVLLGDVFKKRYTIVHKLGFGGHSTVWAARDQRRQMFVALKIGTSVERPSQEIAIFEHIASAPSTLQHPGHAHLPKLLDHFEVEGPNGRHRCMVFDIVGINVGDLVADRLKNNRLSAKHAKSFIKQSLRALDCLHDLGIAHGDVHVRNLVLTAPDVATLSEKDLMSKLGPPEVGTVTDKWTRPLPPNVPEYLIWPACLTVDLKQPSPQVQLIDFGEAFRQGYPPTLLYTPLVVRPPEAIFEDYIDLSADVWAMGCMIFELICGQPPFDTFFVTKRRLMDEMLVVTNETLPERWQAAYDSLRAKDKSIAETPAYDPLQQWLSSVYFDEEREPEFTPEDIIAAGELISSMLRIEPLDRITIKEALRHPWLRDV